MNDIEKINNVNIKDSPSTSFEIFGKNDGTQSESTFTWRDTLKESLNSSLLVSCTTNDNEERLYLLFLQLY